jgi:uncharacterized protein
LSFGSRGFKEDLLRDLRRQREAASRISPDQLASRIREIGFGCLRCGDCCTGPDNSVLAFPKEIRRAMEATGETWQEIAEPPDIGEADLQGDFHTLEWRLKKVGDSCKFYTCRGCSIYDARPILCSTYPFYMEGETLLTSECRGLGREMSLEDSHNLARTLIKRRLTEIDEAISLVEKYSDFERGELSQSGDWVVHDSEGEHRFPKDAFQRRLQKQKQKQ